MTRKTQASTFTAREAALFAHKFEEDAAFSRWGATRNQKTVIILAMVGLVSVLHYGIPLYEPFSHEVFARIYYLPILLGAIWFGLHGGLRVSFLVTLLYLPHLWMGWGHDKTLFWTKILEVPLFILAGYLVGVLTERERKERAKSQELQTLAALGEAAASVAHEIKNVLLPIRGFLLRIPKVCSMEGKAALYMEIVECETARLEEMTRNMLGFARQAPMMKEEIDLSEFMNDLYENFYRDFRTKGVNLICRCHGGVGPVFFDRQRVHQAMTNLLQNALHASSDGGEVRLQSRLNKQFLELVVEDEGVGIAEEQIDRIFHPFFTTKPKGTGLGLALAARVAKEHGGQIRVDSSPGKGTRITLEFPICIEGLA